MTQIWRDILEDFDFWLSDGCAYKDRSILVVDSLQFLEGSIFSGTSVIPHGISTACVVNDFLRFRVDQASDDCKLIWDVSRCQPIPDTKYVLKGVNVFPANPEIDFEVDAQTVLLPLLQDSCLPVRVIELFPGACGGWKTALNFVTQQTGVEFSTLAVDHDLNAAFAYAVSFAVPLVSGNSHVNPALASALSTMELSRLSIRLVFRHGASVVQGPHCLQVAQASCDCTGTSQCIHVA